MAARERQEAEERREAAARVAAAEEAKADREAAALAAERDAARAVASIAARWLDGRVPLASIAFTTLGKGSHRLGWDSPSGAISSAGPRPPADAVGHTGFTGTSVWLSPSRRTVAVLLTNRVAYGRDPARIRGLRHEWHQTVWDEVGEQLPPPGVAR